MEPRWDKPSRRLTLLGAVHLKGEWEVTIYAYAEDAGVSVTKHFTIRPVTGNAALIDENKPAIIAKKLKLPTTPEAFGVLRVAKQAGSLFGSGVTVTVGKGDRNAVTWFGPGTLVTPEAIELLISTSRTALGDDNADVQVGFGEIRLKAGRDLHSILEAFPDGMTVDAAEVQQ